MCQILCLTSHNPEERNAIIQRVWRQMALTQKDGYGAAWFSPDGEIGFLKRRYPCIDNSETPTFIKQAIKSTEDFSLSNDIPSDGGFLIIHGRAATGKICVENTHPFIDELEDGRRVAMIHNGKVDTEKYKNQLQNCTCDSELLMRAYVDGGIDNVERHVNGRYAFMHLEYQPPSPEEIAQLVAEGKEVIGKKTLHIAKDTLQSLHGGLLPDGSFCFATTESLFAKVGAELEGEVENDVLIIFDGKSSYKDRKYEPIADHERTRLNYQQRLNSHTNTNTSSTVANHNKNEQYPQVKDTFQREPTQLEKDLQAAEDREIEELERAPIGI